MDRELKGNLMQSIFRVKKVGVTFSNAINFHMGELFVMGKIAENKYDSEDNVGASDIQDILHVTKPAVSQMLNSLEKKGYISREIDKKDRRRFILMLTPKGEEAMHVMKEQADNAITEIITRFGKENTNQLIDLINRFADVFEEVRDEILPTETKGDE